MVHRASATTTVRTGITTDHLRVLDGLRVLAYTARTILLADTLALALDVGRVPASFRRILSLTFGTTPRLLFGCARLTAPSPSRCGPFTLLTPRFVYIAVVCGTLRRVPYLASTGFRPAPILPFSITLSIGVMPTLLLCRNCLLVALAILLLLSGHSLRIRRIVRLVLGAVARPANEPWPLILVLVEVLDGLIRVARRAPPHQPNSTRRIGRTNYRRMKRTLFSPRSCASFQRNKVGRKIASSRASTTLAAIPTMCAPGEPGCQTDLA